MKTDCCNFYGIDFCVQERLFTIIDIFVTISMIDIEFERLTHAETNQNLYWNRLADQLNYT